MSVYVGATANMSAGEYACAKMRVIIGGRSVGICARDCELGADVSARASAR